MPGEPDPDPTRVRDQPAIRIGRRRQWLVPAGLMAGITVGLLVAALGLETVIPLAGITATALLYLAMLVVAAAVSTARIRNLAFAWLMGIIAVVALGSLLLLLLSERTGA
ncbi:hypothetical protein [Clavibacter californiensis]|uniref:Uncharacterized protein n=1 Tax=Clavibacter californiensis TaxID=1401995 RepID=A0ABX9N3V6_9MICO|nr:hypothetical protein [Clavibacter californiensis]RII90798.1 hypothetical protein DZF98_10955 [Clavibacter californiensis]UKF79893.1 hypothetical protein FGD68_14055 [Clavibacter californiensis]